MVSCALTMCATQKKKCWWGLSTGLFSSCIFLFAKYVLIVRNSHKKLHGNFLLATDKYYYVILTKGRTGGTLPPWLGILLCLAPSEKCVHRAAGSRKN
jgi:hypothetical protein